MTYRRKIHIIGDSIGKGWALGRYEEEITPAYYLYPVYLFRSISSMANNVLYENGIRDEFYYTGVPAVNFSSDISTTVAAIRALIANGTIRSGDVVVAEDAGQHNQDPDLYQSQWEQVRAAVVDRYDITFVMMSMFSYPNAAADYQYSTLFGTRTMNEATVAAYQATIPNERGQTLWVDMKTAMDNWRSSANSVDNVDVMHPDDIHPNVWGQALMVGELLKALNYRPYLNTADGLKNLAYNQYGLLKYGSTTFNATRAFQYMQKCILG
ncbi:hypothetical protein ELG76_04220 [Rhizobium leguminosarum]|uniref:hypothetical protein n=1 Tax=Rhizobium leguminosarum TaxID=384 RepID=UPI00102F68CD|nr:hypothetical protein [Rhizobium leguminosarum]TBG78626.1 hypothetical protein ELG76_04220 [Rhizobium leguminosarum]